MPQHLMSLDKPARIVTYQRACLGSRPLSRARAARCSSCTASIAIVVDKPSLSPRLHFAGQENWRCSLRFQGVARVLHLIIAADASTARRRYPDDAAVASTSSVSKYPAAVACFVAGYEGRRCDFTGAAPAHCSVPFN